MKIKKFKWMRFHNYLYKQKRTYLTSIVLRYLAIPFSLIAPYISKLIIDESYVKRDLYLFTLFITAAAFSMGLDIIIRGFARFFEQNTQREIRFEMATDIFNHLQTLPIKYFKDIGSGELLYKISEDVMEVQYFVYNTTTKIVSLIPNLLIRFAIIFTINWQFAIMVGVLSITSYITPYFFAKKMTSIKLSLTNKSQNVFHLLHDVISQMHIIKALNTEDYEKSRYSKGIEDNKDFDFKHQQIVNLSDFTKQFTNSILLGSISVYAGYQMIKGFMTLGDLMAIMVYVGQIFPLFGQIGNIIENIKTSSISRERISRIFDAVPTIKIKGDALKPKDLMGDIEFKQVSFGYGLDEKIFDGVSLKFPRKSRIALIGESGCGKSTLFALILRMYDIQKGEILIDGMDIRDYDLKHLKKYVGLALQETYLWDSSILENIRYGSDDISEIAVHKAIEIVRLTDMIEKLPDGLDTRLGEHASKISQGQKQRIAIARAIVNKPRILILDEAMSFIDSKTEEGIINSILEYLPETNIIITSHRLSTVKKMDEIYFIQSPSKITIGNHGSLMNFNNRYVELFGSQINQA